MTSRAARRRAFDSFAHRATPCSARRLEPSKVPKLAENFLQLYSAALGIFRARLRLRVRGLGSRFVRALFAAVQLHSFRVEGLLITLIGTLEELDLDAPSCEGKHFRVKALDGLLTRERRRFRQT